jgi:hypothetical protein
MSIRIPKNNCQQEGRRALFERHPRVGEHHAWAVINPNNVMIKIRQLFGLLTRADRNRLVGVKLIQGLGILPSYHLNSWAFQKCKYFPPQKQPLWTYICHYGIGKVNNRPDA